MSFTLRPVRVATGPDEDGILVFSEDRLVAVLVQLSDAHTELGVTGHWFLETGYGPLNTRDDPVFPDLDAAQAWIRQRL
jgi:hypothetical protein